MIRPLLRLCSHLCVSAASIAAIVLGLYPQQIAAQSFEHAPFYQKTAIPPDDALLVRHATANGVKMDISVASNDTGWEQGVRTDGSPKREMVHLYIQPTDSGATFAYDLLVEPIAATHKVRCTFIRQSSEQFSEYKQATQTIPLPQDLAPVIIDDGGTLAISLFADRDKKQRLTQYLHFTITTTNQQAWATIPVINQSCVRIR